MVCRPGYATWSWMDKMAELDFSSPDRRYGLIVPAPQLQELLDLCRAAERLETGGVLVGYHSARRDCAIAKAVLLGPSDSQRGGYWFMRGVRGLHRRLIRYWWQQRQFYLGEWHYHPYSSAQPSSQDISQMQQFAADPRHPCPEPILLVMGGDPNGSWTAEAVIFVRGQPPVRLLPA